LIVGFGHDLLADKFCRQIEEHPLAWQSATISVTVSIGLISTSTSVRQAFDFEPLYRGADTVLSQAKDQGRNRVVVHVWASNPMPAAK